MKIAIDVDGVIADIVESLLVWHNKEYKTNFEKKHVVDFGLRKMWGGTREEELEKLDAFFKTEHFDNVSPIDGAQQAISKLKEKHDLVVITARPVHIKEKTHSWISRHFPDKFSDIVLSCEWKMPIFKPNKSAFCKQLGAEVIVEDSLCNAIECAEAGIKVFLMNRPWNQSDNLPELVTRVNSWEEVVERLS